MKGNSNFSLFSLFLSLFAVIVFPLSLLAYTQTDYKNSLLKIANRIALLQNTDGSWPLTVTNLTYGDGTFQEHIIGSIADALLDGYFYEANERFLDAAVLAGNWIKTFKDTNQWLYPADALFLKRLSEVTGNSAYLNIGQQAVNYLHNTKYPTALALVNEITARNKNICFELSEYIEMFAQFGYSTRANQLADNFLLDFQVKTGDHRGIFLSSEDTVTLKKYYWMRDTAKATEVLHKLNPSKYYTQIQWAKGMIKQYQDTNPRAKGAFIAGHIYNPLNNQWAILPDQFNIFDHSTQLITISKLKDKSSADKATDYLLATQRTTEGYEGWYIRKSDWDSPADMREWSYYDARCLSALSSRLKLNQPPFILMAGWLRSNISEDYGGYVDLIAWAVDPDGDDIPEMRIYDRYKTPPGYELPLYGNGIFWLSEGGDKIFVSKGVPEGRYLFQLVAFDDFGAQSAPWPYLYIYSENGYPVEPHTYNWNIIYYKTIGERVSVRAPFILAAGYYYTLLIEGQSGVLNLVAVIDDIDSLRDIKRVEIHSGGVPTGTLLYDDGKHGDFAAGDGVFGMQMLINAPILQGLGGQAFLLELVATDYSGRKSTMWPYLQIDP